MELQNLRAMRRIIQNASERKNISKQIWRKTRDQLRQYRTKQAEEKLNEFSKLESLGKLHLYPIKKTHTIGPNLEACAKLLQQVYTTDNELNYSTNHSVPAFTFEEVKHALKCMRKGRCCDKDGMFLEMFLHCGSNNLQILCTYLNEILENKHIPDRWCDTFFSLLHKGGSTEDPNNWRRVAILSITYKIFARLVYHRIRKDLDAYQSEDQFGFRHSRSTTHALLIIECMFSKEIEFNVPVWVMTIDLRKAFDRVDHTALFRSLRRQMDHDHVALLELLYKTQHGNVGTHCFPITRGVRQGDVLSPVLFNAVLECAMAKWKTKLRSHGFCLHPDNEHDRLTNIRYADDILLFGKSLEEVVSMVELLAEVLREFGLDLNTSKTKILSTEDNNDAPVYCITECGTIEVLATTSKYKYLGRMFSGNVRDRGRIAVEHRICCGWMKFKALQHIFQDKHIPVKLRLKLFDAAISSTVLYSLESCPITESIQSRLDVVQRTMLRRLIGWISFAEEIWESIGHKMKMQLQKCLEKHPIDDWRFKFVSVCLHIHLRAQPVI